MLLWVRFVQRAHKLLNCWVMTVKPQLGENNHEIIKLCGFIKNWWTLGRVLGFSLRVLRFEVP